MKTDHISDQDICLYVDALKLQRTDELPAAIVSHVSDCAECKGKVMQLYDVLRGEDYQKIGGHPVLTPPVDARPGPHSYLYRLAATLAVMLASGAIAYFAFIRESPDVHTPLPATAQGPADTGSTGGKEQPRPAIQAGEYADNFVPSPNLEDLLDAGFRAAAVTIDSPANGQVRGGDIVFRWTSRSAKAFRVRILTNREEEVFQETTDRHTIVCNKSLPPGLYYWTLQEDGELVHVGKMIVPVP